MESRAGSSPLLTRRQGAAKSGMRIERDRDEEAAARRMQTDRPPPAEGSQCPPLPPTGAAMTAARSRPVTGLGTVTARRAGGDETRSSRRPAFLPSPCPKLPSGTIQQTLTFNLRGPVRAAACASRRAPRAERGCPLPPPAPAKWCGPRRGHVTVNHRESGREGPGRPGRAPAQCAQPRAGAQRPHSVNVSF